MIGANNKPCPQDDAVGPAQAQLSGAVESPMVSVVIPVWNDAIRLDRCLASLAQQHYPRNRFEVIVVDNASTDESLEVAARHRTKVLSFPKLKVGALRNRGVKVAEGEVLAFVDSDHELPPDWIVNGVTELRDNATTSAVGAPCLAPESGSWVQRIWALHRLRDLRRGETEWLGAGNMFVRRLAFDAIEGFREDLTAAEDVDLCVRIKQNGGKIVSAPRVANVHWGEPATIGIFLRKEFWRGSNGLRTFVAHKCPWHELPSLAFPVYHLLACITTLAAVFLYFFFGGPGWCAVGALGLLVGPSVLLALRTTSTCGRLASAPALAVLYLTYGLARAAALFRI